MRLHQIVGTSSIPQLIRHRLETSDFYSAATAQQVVQREFPNHIVSTEPGKISVQVRDKSFSVAVFREVL